MLKPAIFLSVLSIVRLGAAEFTVRIPAAEPARTNAIVSVSVGEEFPERGLLSGEDSTRIPFQRIADHVFFVLPETAREAALEFKVQGGSPAAVVSAKRTGGSVAILAGEKPVFEYQGEATSLPRPEIKAVYQRGGYIHPVHTPGGSLVTDDYPRNHIHHHGIWFPWTRTVFEGRMPDFWNMGEGKGRVEFANLGNVWSGPVAAGFSSTHRFVDLTGPEPKTALNEAWSVTAYSAGDRYYLFDLVSTQTCATASALQLPKYHYGGLGFRGNWEWNGTDKTYFLTSNGETNRVKGNETRARWCYIGGEVEGRMAGIAILGHPDNFRAPQPVRLHPSEPFFCFAPSQLGDWEITPGKPYVSRYRFVTFDGEPDRAFLDSLWLDYAEPVPAQVVPGRNRGE